jgi:uncharacterized protein YbjT (DUF2867 family)
MVSGLEGAGIRASTWAFDKIMTTKEYHDRLAGVAELLSLRGIDADCRGDGAARFVYAAKDRRAIELSWDGVGVFIEMFEESSEISIRDEQQDTFDIGVQSAIEWLEKTNEEIEQGVRCNRR